MADFNVSHNIIDSVQHIHLTGIKGVAMTSIAQCLVDMGKVVTGTDLAEEFVTSGILKTLNIPIATEFTAESLPTQAQLVIYTAAHQGPQNIEVQEARKKQIPTISQAEALGLLFNEKQGVAVSGVGGKSTTSAMVTWILASLQQPVSFSVGVGSIIGLPRTGQWQEQSQYFIAEADEYVIDPMSMQRDGVKTPRFFFLHPSITVCTQIEFDHPDVYIDLEDTKKNFQAFFNQLKPNGTLIINGEDVNSVAVAKAVTEQRSDVTVLTFGTLNGLNGQLNSFTQGPQFSTSQLTIDGAQHTLELKVPGQHNAKNAAAALLAIKVMGVDLNQAIAALKNFASTQRRFEYKGEKNGVIFYDDYAHHPREIAAIIQTITSMFSDKRIVVAFQPHTYSRTKSLFDEFVKTLSQAKEVWLLDIFVSAREAADPTITSQMLLEAIRVENTNCQVRLLSTAEELARTAQLELQKGDVFITLGAGDIYKMHDLIS